MSSRWHCWVLQSSAQPLPSQAPSSWVVAVSFTFQEKSPSEEHSSEVSSFPPLQAGWDALGRAVCFPSLLFPFLRLINMAIQLLQDEEREVRHEASGFASLLRQSPGEPLRDGCVFVQDNVGLQSLLQLLLGEFREHPETFNSLLQHIPILDLRSIVEELEANK